MWKEFKEFINRGNVMDMAVGVIIGAAFKAIVDSLVADIITPLIMLATPANNIESWGLVLRAGEYNEAGEEIVAPLVLKYGSFISSIISFLMVSLVIFFMVKSINKFNAKFKDEKEEEAEEEPAESQEDILKDIRTLLEKK